MRILKKIRLRLRSMFRRDRVERELEAELRFHLDQQIDENLVSGMTPEEARRAALRVIGGITQFQEECREMRRINFIENLIQDLCFAIRALRKRPGSTATPVLTLALGIGATTAAVFSVVNAVLLRPLPYHDPHRLVWIHDGMTPHDTEGWPACMADFLLWRERARSFSRLAAYSYEAFALVGEGDVERVPGALVSAQFFQVLGITALHGQTFASDADRPGKTPVALISERLWRRKFASRENTIGRMVTIDGRAVTIIGVFPPNFTFLAPDTDIWLILTLKPPTRRGPFYLRGVGRLAPDVTLAQASSELDALGRGVERDDPLGLTHSRYPVIPLQQEIVGNVRPLLLVLSGTVFWFY